jgi:ArsR family metal-binding transcriptional regulator
MQCDRCQAMIEPGEEKSLNARVPCEEKSRMILLTNPMEIFKSLDRSNCRKCNEWTCMAFAAAVFKGQRQLSECPHLEGHDLAHSAENSEGRVTNEQELEFMIEELKNRLASVDLC